MNKVWQDVCLLVLIGADLGVPAALVSFLSNRIRYTSCCATLLIRISGEKTVTVHAALLVHRTLLCFSAVHFIESL